MVKLGLLQSCLMDSGLWLSGRESKALIGIGYGTTTR